MAEDQALDPDAGAGDAGAGDATEGDVGERHAGASDAGETGEATDRTGPDARSVVVPSRVYKSVTVFSTLFAVLTIVGGFVVLDSATRRASVSLSEADPVLALAGLGLIALGTVTYAFSTRFTAAGMGNAKDGTDEESDNG